MSFQMLKNNTENTVTLTVYASNLTGLLNYLMNERVPFEVTFGDKSDVEQVAKTISDGGDTIQKSKFPKEEIVVETIYKEYITCVNLAQPRLDDTTIAKKYGLTIINFRNTFTKRYGKTFQQLYMDKRMEYAAELLRNSYKAVEVSKLVGYGEKSCIKFNKMFQKHFGMTPKKYQMSQK
jgi:AraC-like DNA-binding protein